jgi:hypothetical protein
MITGELVLSQMLAWWPLEVGSCLHGDIDTSLQVRHYDNPRENSFDKIRIRILDVFSKNTVSQNIYARFGSMSSRMIWY